MGLGLAPVDGTWWDTTYDQPVYGETVTTDIVTERQAVSAQPVNDEWSAFWQRTIGTVTDYALKKDAAETGVELRQAQMTPVYSQPAYQPRSQPQGGTLLLMGLAVVVGVVLAK